MPVFSLKRYQDQALLALESYLSAARIHGARAAFEKETGYGYQPDPFGEVPCVCLRIPTGGGKTLLAAHAIGRMVRAWPHSGPTPTSKPVALWLVPSETIRAQTLLALSRPGHPFREALVEVCGESVTVCALEDVAQLSPQDHETRTLVVVATIQSFRIEDTDQRNVYAFSEKFEPHFRGTSPSALNALRSQPDALVTADEAASDKAGRAMLGRFVSQPRWSLANWLALHQPYVIVDEAHNTKTERSFEALLRLNPAMILELTATPVPKRTNVLFHVSAQQLQAEHMIKMPIALIEHTRGWQAAVLDAVQNQCLLEAEAQQEEAETGAYIRPIVLLQAENSDRPVTVEVLKHHLLAELHIPEDQIKVATGTHRELEGLDLSRRDCPVRYIITVQALREGWDCPFAYILCSVQSVRSATAIEQLLGRVLRMPYATKRQRPALNKAYAHVTEAETGMAANALADRLIDGMGFDPLDMASMIAPQLPLALNLPDNADGSCDDGPLFQNSAFAAPLPALTVDLPAGRSLPSAVAEAQASGQVSLSTDGDRQRIRLEGAVSQTLADALVAAQRGKQREQTREQIDRHNLLVSAALAPAQRGVVFKPLPRLCYPVPGQQGELALLEREVVFEAVDLNLLAEPISLPGFHMAEQGTLWEVYLDGQKLRVGRGDARQMALDSVSSAITEHDLMRWLSDELQHPSRNLARDVVPSHLRAFVLAAVRHLVNDQHIPLAQLARHQYTLVQQLAHCVAGLRDKAAGRAFTQLVLDGGWAVRSSVAHAFRFEAGNYPVPAHKRYRGKFVFSKHYFGNAISDLEDGGEEWRCAMELDEHPAVKHWVRNIDSDPVAGFWLPTSLGRFYPDFVCELNDGRLFVAEYKGEHLRNVPKEIEKGQVGQVWAERSDGQCLFAMLFKQARGLNLRQQLDLVLC
jgi:type III restriction enzyme